MGKTFSELNEIQKWISENLLTKSEAAAITGQSLTGFNQSVAIGKIAPFYVSSGTGSSKVKLYLRSDIEHYRDTKRS